VFDAATGQYEPNVVTVAQPPTGTVTNSSTTPTSTNDSQSSTPDSNSTNDTNPPASTNNTGNTGTSNNNDTNNNTSNNYFGLFYNANISNSINESAQSGTAAINGNTLAGNASSGNVLAVANVINLLQSSASGMSTFVSNITGNVAGDLLLDPNIVTQPSSDSSQTTNTNNTTQVNSANNSSINNNVALNANSGNANVSNNTSAGSATSGSADAVANIVNLINSDISSGQSFLGVINIYGDLEGNILLPPDFLNSLLASNANSDPVTGSNGNSATTVDNTNNNTINNSITNNATTGAATIGNNTSAGNATSGNADTNITVLNLTGSQVIGSNDLLVFVNVLGTWIGVIMDAPAGATAAELGGGITNNSTIPNGTTTVNSTNNNTINNNINDNASSGNATVTNNTSAGNATSGNATSSVNLLNLIDSQLSVSNWFGILFINVFGTWDGSLGEETLPAVVTTAATLPPVSTPTTNSNPIVYKTVSNNGNYSLVPATITVSSVNNNPSGNHGLNSSILVSSRNNSKSSGAKTRKPTSSISLVAFSIAGAGIILLGAERVRSRKKQPVE
jgi:hypothetical protein